MILKMTIFNRIIDFEFEKECTLKMLGFKIETASLRGMIDKAKI